MNKKLTNARAEAQDALLTGRNDRVLQPAAAVIVGTEQAVRADILVLRQLGQRTLKFGLGEVQSEIVDLFGGILEGLEKQVHLAEVAGRWLFSIDQKNEKRGS